MSHPLVLQLRFTRNEFLRGLTGLTEAEASRHFAAMNCISWNVGHLAWQEQRYFLHYAQGCMPHPEIDRQFAYGAPASAPGLGEMISTWESITQQVDLWLETLDTSTLQEKVIREGKVSPYIFGSLLLRVIYHYWYHNGENQAIRQMLGHQGLPEFVGDLDGEAPYRPE
jgi:hypothetical protein